MRCLPILHRQGLLCDAKVDSAKWAIIAWHWQYASITTTTTQTMLVTVVPVVYMHFAPRLVRYSCVVNTSPVLYRFERYRYWGIGYWPILAGIGWYWYWPITFFSNHAQYWAVNSLRRRLSTHDDLISGNSLWSQQLPIRFLFLSFITLNYRCIFRQCCRKYRLKIGMFHAPSRIIHRQTCNRKYAKTSFRSWISKSTVFCDKTVAHCN